MSKRSHKARPTFVADFETTTDPDDCRVWLWSAVRLNGGNPFHGLDIDSFVEWVSSFSGIVNFHNLKFDAVFILFEIMNNRRFRHVDKAEFPGEFDTLIDKMGKYYQIRVVWDEGVVTEFRDSLKKLPYKVSEIAKAFNLPIAKGEIDYDKVRPVGYEPTEEEIEYAYLDVLIVAAALEQQINEGMTRLTAGSDSLGEFKRLFGANAFKKIFPVLNHKIDADIRLCYRGGYTFRDERFAQRLIEGGSVYDINSMYPSIMYTKLLPYGEPVWCEGYVEYDKNYPLSITSITFTAKLKENHIPILQIKGGTMFSSTEYQSTIDEPTTLSFTNVDLELLHKHYDVEILSYNGGWKFKGKVGFFDEFIEKWMKIKEESTGALREIAKLQLNSLYGKFGSNPSITGKYPVIEDGRVKLKIDKDETREPIYTAMAVFITSYGRQIVAKAAQDNYEHFAYCDTDSIHLTTTAPPVGLELHPTKLGAWDHEGDFDKAFYVRAKAYIERIVTCRHGSFLRCGECTIKCVKFSVHIAGVPSNISEGIRFEDMYDGREFWGKLTPKNVPGGVVLVKGGFTLKL